MTDKEAMKLALFALDIVKIHYTQSRHVNEAITALKERLAQPEQEPAGDDIASILACRDMLDAQPVPPRSTEQNFCSRCGKRTNDIHTCTPPKD
jgi:hypothetical protein